MLRIPAVFTLIILGTFFINCSRAAENRQSNPYNILLIVSDALRIDVLGCYGGDIKTPNIDWIAGQGTLFENAYSTAPCTESSAVAMFTGNYSTSYKVINNNKRRKNSKRIYSFYVNKREQLLAEALKEMDFDVVMEVENGIAMRSNNLQGFEKLKNFEQMNEDEVALVEKTIGVSLSDWDDGSKLHHVYNLLHYLLRVKPARHFFLMKWFMDPHMPFTPVEKFKKKIIVDPSKLTEKIGFYSKKRDIAFRRIERRRGITDYEYYYLKELYKAEVRSIDERVGLILKALKYRKLLDKTVIIFTTDHGELFGEKGKRGHGNYLYEPLIHIPLIIMGPGIPGGRRVKTRISNVGLMATLKDLLNVKHTNNMQGKSFKPLFYAEAEGDDVLFFDGNNKNMMSHMSSYGLLMGDYKLITNREDNETIHELYNLKIDPGEKINIVKENPEILKKMLNIIAEFREKNEIRRKYNLSKIDKQVNLSEEWEKTREKLKALGYID